MAQRTEELNQVNRATAEREPKSRDNESGTGCNAYAIVRHEQVVNNGILTLILAGLAMVGPFAIDTFLPSFPAIAQGFDVSMAVVQQTLSVYLSAFALMSLFYGTLSDSFGRRPVILGSLLLFTVASVGAALAPTFGWLLAFRVLQGLSAGGGRVIGQAIIRDRFEGPAAHRLMAQVTMVFGLAPAIAPVLGGYLHAAFGWRSVFVFMAIFGLALLFGTHYYLDESLSRGARTRFHPTTLAKNYATALCHGTFVARALAVGFAFGGLALYIASAASFVIRLLHLPETAFAWLFVPMIGGMVLGSALGARLARHAQPTAVFRLGFSCMAVAVGANLAYNSFLAAAVPWAVLPIMLYTFGLGLTMPGMTVKALDVFPTMRGLAASLVTFVQMLVFSLVSGVIAPMVYDSAMKLAAGLATFFLLTLFFWGAGRKAP